MSITELMEYLYEWVDGALNSQQIRGESSPGSAYAPTAALFQVSTRFRKPKKQTKRTPEPYRAFCELRGYWGQDGQQITGTRERIEELKATNRCFLCLNRGHAARQCAKKSKVSCTVCKGRNHKSICDADRTNDVPALPTNFKSISKIDAALPNYTYLQTARFRIVGPTGLSRFTRCVLDSGSQTSFGSAALINALKLDVTEQQNLAVGAFESPSFTSSLRRLVCLDLRGIWTYSSITITAFESAYEFLPQPTVPYDVNMMMHIPKVQFADPKEKEDLPIEILVGGDPYWKIVKDSPPWCLLQSIEKLPSRLG
jgi:hypothetical protein